MIGWVYLYQSCKGMRMYSQGHDALQYKLLAFERYRRIGWCSGQPVPCGGIHSRESVGSDPVLAPALEFCVWRSRFALPDYITAQNQGDRGLPEPSKARASSPAGFHRVWQRNPGLWPRDHVTTTSIARPTYPLWCGKPQRCLAHAQPDRGAGVTDGSGLGLWGAWGR